jgi:23S rRNA pseudouridine2605 synthase
MSEPVRLQVYLSRRGLGSRRNCEQYIREGRVTVNGRQATLGCSVGQGDRVLLDRKPLPGSQTIVHLAVHKPPGFLCANQDARGRPLVTDILADVPVRVYHVGRLDFQSSGLIFYTNDGRFARTVMHPSSRIEKEYLVETREPIAPEHLARFQRGIALGGERYRLKRYTFRTPRQVLLTLVEGKNREIRLVFEHFGVELRSIHRVRIGCVHLKGIPKGGYRSLSKSEVHWFYEHAAHAPHAPHAPNAPHAGAKSDGRSH